MSLPLSTSESSENLMDWFQLHSKKAGWGAAIVVVLAAGGWFYVQSQELRAERAEKAYYEAQRSLMAGNLPLAESDLRKMIERYDGTKPAMGARLVLAQVLYDQGKYQEGVDLLQAKARDIGRSREFGSSVHLIIAGGLEQLQKHKEAGAAYEDAAKAARFDPDRERYETLAARAYLTGADTTKARELWTKLGADSKGTVAGEARVRLGELDAKAQQPAG
ncbi:MAG: tetratricopeptide repeat protein [Gemmatimonadaceae bacterium]